MATKIVLLLALAMGALVLCEATTVPSPPASSTFHCPRGLAVDGNNRPRTLPTCVGPAVLCCTGDCSDGRPCAATCRDGTKLTLTRDSVGVVTFCTSDGKAVFPQNGFYKGCNAYCRMPAFVPAYVPVRKDGRPCGLSHADFCYCKN